MKRLIFIVLVCGSINGFAQNREWHVKPVGDNYTSTNGDGTSLETAWSLQQALNNPSVKPGDVIYLHEGIYQGHFSCSLEGNSWEKNNEKKQFITIKSFPGEFATINGHIYDGQYRIPTGMNLGTIFLVSGKYVHFENFRITCMGNFTRIVDNNDCNPKDIDFHGYTGVRHDPKSTAPCRFINLIVDNIPGVGFASWKETADTEIYGCLMYYNGYMKSLRKDCNAAWDTHDADSSPSNVLAMENCIYTQNVKTHGKTRLIRNNIFANNYKSGIAIWSANKNPDFDYLHNYRIEENVFINNGGPVRSEAPNLLISSDTKTASNHPGNIDVVKNIFYLNSSNDISGIMAVNNTDVRIENNEFYHGTAALELRASNKKITFRNNLYVGKRIKVLAKPEQFWGAGKPDDAWKMSGNTYYTTNSTNLFLTGRGNFSLADFKLAYRTEQKSDQPQGMPPIRKNIFQNEYNPNRFHITYYNKTGNTGNVDFDFSPYRIPDGMSYTIRDAEDYHHPVASGKFDKASGKIAFPVSATPGFEYPLPSAESGKTAWVTKPVHSNTNFRVYVIEFDCAYNLTKSNTTVSARETYSAQQNLQFGPAFTATDASTVTAKAGNEILFVDGCHIAGDDEFVAKIEPVACPAIPLKASKP
jgi:hypothetical protein